MKFNEYELTLTSDKLSLKTKRKFDKKIRYIDDILGFLLSEYDLLHSAFELER